MRFFTIVCPLIVSGAVWAQNEQAIPAATPQASVVPEGAQKAPAQALPAHSYVTNGVFMATLTNQVPPTSILGTNLQVRPLTLGDAITEALQNNYGLQISRLNPSIREFELAGTYAVYEPELNFGAGYRYVSRPGGVIDVGNGVFIPASTETQTDYFNAGIGGFAPTGLRYDLTGQASHTPRDSLTGDDTDANWQFRLEQPLLRNLWMDGNRRAIQLGKNNLRFSEWELRQGILQTIYNVEIGYYNLIAARENIRVARAALDTANQLLRENKKRVEVGAMAPLEEKQSEAEVARAVADLLRAEQDYAVALNNLKNLVTQSFAQERWVVLDPVEALVALPVRPDLAESWRKGLTYRPELQMLKLNLAAHDINLKYFKNQLWPEVNLVATYGHLALDNDYSSALDALNRDRNPQYSIGGVLRIPLGNRGPRNNYKAEKTRKQQAVLEYKQLEQTIMMDIDNAAKLLQSRFEEVEATRQARLFSQDALTAEQRKYENGKSTSYTVLQFQRDLTRARYQEISALAQYNIALAALALSEGTTLDRHNLNFGAEEQLP